MNQLLRTYQRDLALRGFAERTCEHYTTNVRQFLAYYQQRKKKRKRTSVKTGKFISVLAHSMSLSQNALKSDTFYR